MVGETESFLFFCLTLYNNNIHYSKKFYKGTGQKNFFGDVIVDFLRKCSQTVHNYNFFPSKSAILMFYVHSWFRFRKNSRTKISCKCLSSSFPVIRFLMKDLITSYPTLVSLTRGTHIHKCNCPHGSGRSHK